MQHCTFDPGARLASSTDTSKAPPSAVCPSSSMLNVTKIMHCYQGMIVDFVQCEFAVYRHRPLLATPSTNKYTDDR